MADRIFRSRLAALVLAAAASCALGQTQKTVLMVAPRVDEPSEIAFREYLVRSGAPVKFQTLSSAGRDPAALVAEVRRIEPDLIYTWSTPTTLALAGTFDSPPERFIHDIPIVFAGVTDPVGSGLLHKLSAPGRNVTGVSHVAPLVAQVKAMRSYQPVHRLGYITNPKEPNTQLVLQELRRVAAAEHIEVFDETIPLAANGAPDAASLPDIIRRLAAKHLDYLYIGPSTFLAFTHKDLVTQTALEAGVATFCTTELVLRRSRCMFGMFSDSANIGRFAAYKAARIIVDGKAPSEVPAETLQRFSLLINMPVARTLHRFPPLPLLDVAEIVEK